MMRSLNGGERSWKSGKGGLSKTCLVKSGS